MKRIKVYLLTLCIILGMFQTVVYAADKPFDYDEDGLVSNVKSLIEQLNEFNETEINHMVNSSVGFSNSACENFAEYIKNDSLGEFKEFGDSSAKAKGDTVLITVTAKYEKTDLEVTVSFISIFDEITPTSFESKLVSNSDDSLGKRILNAGLNTLIGLTTVFLMLFIISEIIGLFRFIPRLQKKYENKKKNKKLGLIVTSTKEDVFDQITEKENLVNDTELVAVITAAISASTNASADSFVVRSIKKSKRKYI